MRRLKRPSATRRRRSTHSRRAALAVLSASKTLGSHKAHNLQTLASNHEVPPTAQDVPRTRPVFGQDTAARHEIHSEGDRQSDKLRLDLKLARIDKHFYKDNAPGTWHKNVRTYLIGTHSDMAPILNWFEARGKVPITGASLTEMAKEAMIQFCPVQAARELWSWIHLTLEHSTSAQRTFHNVEELNGLEVYRALVTPLGVTKCSQTRRNHLRDKVQQPQRAKSMTTVMDAVAEWRANKLAYAKAEGTPHGDEEERAQLYKILPAGISQDMLSHAHDQPTAFKLLEWMEEKSLFLQEHGGSAAAHVTEEGVPPPPQPHDENYPPPEAYWEEDEPVTEEQVAKMFDSELLAFVRKGGSFKGGRPTKGGRKGGWRKGEKGGARKGGEPPPRNRADLRCINCGGKGHTWRDCKEAEVPREKRPCVNCGKPGHLSRDCRPPKALTVDGGGEHAGRHFNLDSGDQEARSCEADTPNFRDPSLDPRAISL